MSTTTLTDNEAQHAQFGKMAEGTQHWNTRQHPAFKKLRTPPPSTKSANSTSSSPDPMSILNNLITKNKTTQILEEPNLWVITEKIHGSNMSIVVTPGKTGKMDEKTQQPLLNVRCAKREEFLNDSNLDDNNTFFGYLKVKKQLEEPARRAFRTIIAENSEKNDTVVVGLTIYGELFGGTFPGLPTPSDVKMPVQDGLYYSPDLHFICFDVALHVVERNDSSSSSSSDPKKKEVHKEDDNKNKNNNDDDDDDNSQNKSEATSGKISIVPLPFIQSMKLLHDAGFPLVSAPLAVGSFDDCCNYNIDFTTSIPERLGIPKEVRTAIASKNKAEGIVCRTNQPQKVPVLSGKPGQQERCMFKRKQDNFAAWCDERAKNTTTLSSSTSSGRDEKSSVFDFVKNQFLTNEVVFSAMSKTGRPKDPKVDCKIMKRLKSLVVSDAVEGLDNFFCPKFFSGGGGGAAASSSSSSSSKAAKFTKKNQGIEDVGSSSYKTGEQLLCQYQDEMLEVINKKVVEALSSSTK